MALKPYNVIEKIKEYYEKYPACTGRSKHKLSLKLSEEIKKCREEIKDLINAKTKNEIVFLRNSTEGINLLSKGLNLKKGDIVIISDKEHNSNLISWIKLKEKLKIKILVMPTNKGFLNIDYFKEILQKTM